MKNKNSRLAKSLTQYYRKGWNLREGFIFLLYVDVSDARNLANVLIAYAYGN